MPTDNRATAERIAREVVERNADRHGGATWGQHSAFGRARFTDVALAGMTHRDRTAEREDITDERMQAAWDEAYRRVKSPNGLKVEWSEHRPVDIAWHREFIAAFLGLAAEFDAGERVTLSDGSVVWCDSEGRWCRSDSIGAWWKVRSHDWTGVLNAKHTGADFDKLKAFAAEQRGAER